MKYGRIAKIIIEYTDDNFSIQVIEKLTMITFKFEQYIFNSLFIEKKFTNEKKNLERDDNKIPSSHGKKNLTRGENKFHKKKIKFIKLK